MLNKEIQSAIVSVAANFGIEAAALKAFVETESEGVAFAFVDGANEPLIRWEGHYFYRLCADVVRERAVKAGLAAYYAGAIKNPASQEARWDKLLRPAIQIDRQAAYESCSWGLGQVMGANWKMLGFQNVLELVDLARRDVRGQIDLMARYIERTGLKGALIDHDWTAVAKGYNGPAYSVNRYDIKMAVAYEKYREAKPIKKHFDGDVASIQAQLIAHGFNLIVDGVRGPKTTAAIEAFQKANHLNPDGIVGRFTVAALKAEPSKGKAA